MAEYWAISKVIKSRSEVFVAGTMSGERESFACFLGGESTEQRESTECPFESLVMDHGKLFPNHGP
jgi:hypothetical protein